MEEKENLAALPLPSREEKEKGEGPSHINPHLSTTPQILRHPGRTDRGACMPIEGSLLLLLSNEEILLFGREIPGTGAKYYNIAISSGSVCIGTQQQQ